MRIAFISTILSYPWGGADVLWTRAAALALAEGHHVMVAVSPLVAGHPRMVALQSAGAEVVVRVESTREVGRRSRWRQAAERAIRSPRSLTGSLDRFRPDFVYVCQGGVFDFLVEAGLDRWLVETGCAFALICQANDEHAELSASEKVNAQRVLARARRTIFVSSHNRDHAARQVEAPVPRAVVVPNPIELPHGELPLAWPEEALPRLAVLARLEADVKGLDVLLEALGQVAHDAELRVDLYGRGPDEAALRARASELGLGTRLNFCGFVADVRSIWAGHHCLLLSSRSEGCALAMLEAMACGRPVITTDVGGAGDWVQDGVNGFICPPGDVGALTAALERAVGQFGRWFEMGEASARRIRLHHAATPESQVLSAVGSRSA